MLLNQRDVEHWASQHSCDQEKCWLEQHTKNHNHKAYQELCDQYAYETDPRNVEKWAND